VCASSKRSQRRSTLGAACFVLGAACFVLVLGGCATFDPPKPWEKGDLARPSMRLDADQLAAKTTQHNYHSKEGAAGGGPVGGGGCGCN
jgi:hypothetical protein